MTITAPSAVNQTAPTPAPPPSTSSTSNTTLDRQAFLKLLVAQLKNQDPSKPMDASAMISQSAQLSVVDKLNEISTALSNSGLTERLTLAGSVIGKSVTFKDADGKSQTQTVTAARFVDGSMVLTAGDWDVPIAAVTAIAGAIAPTTAPSTTPTAPTPTAPTPTAPSAAAPAASTSAASTSAATAADTSSSGNTTADAAPAVIIPASSGAGPPITSVVTSVVTPDASATITPEPTPQPTPQLQEIPS